MADFKWHSVENGADVKPELVDNKSSKAYAYFRRNIQRVEATEDMPAHYRWEEIAIPKEALHIYEKAKENEAGLEDAYDGLADLAEVHGAELEDAFEGLTDLAESHGEELDDAYDGLVELAGQVDEHEAKLREVYAALTELAGIIESK